MSHDLPDTLCCTRDRVACNMHAACNMTLATRLAARLPLGLTATPCKAARYSRFLCHRWALVTQADEAQDLLRRLHGDVLAQSEASGGAGAAAPKGSGALRDSGSTAKNDALLRILLQSAPVNRDSPIAREALETR